MRPLRFLCFCLFFLPFLTWAQPVLKPSIGLANQPLATDSICPIPLYLGNFYSTGIPEGDTVPDFTLYNLSGQAVTLSAELAQGKPILLVSGSYTCPVFRGKIPLINQIATQYANDLKVLVIYALEAHPVTDTSPYFGYVNVTNANLQDSVLYRQPMTYGEREAIAGDMLGALPINAELVLDGPCNEWWSTFGPAPNNAYLLDTKGIVFRKHGWFDKYPDDIFCDLDSLLGVPGNCGGANGGQFTFQMISDTFDLDLPGQTLSVYGELSNSSNEDVLVRIVKLQTNLPNGWAASLCTDVCYPSTVDTALVQLAAGQTQSFTFYFYTDTLPGTGLARVGFRNEANTQNNYVYRYTGTTDEGFVGVAEEIEGFEPEIYPNPARDKLRIDLPAGKNGILSIYDLTGKRRLQQEIRLPKSVLNLNQLEAGFYIWTFEGDGQMSSGKFFRE